MYVPNLKVLYVKDAVSALKNQDKELVTLLDTFKPSDIFPEINHFKSLTRYVIYQQLSGKAAKKISDRFISLYKGKNYPTPQDVCNTEYEILSSVGLSNAKAHYIKNIAKVFLDNRIEVDNLQNLPDDEVINKLMSIKGVGLWTAQMFLMFTLARPDIFPTGDLGLQKGFQKYFKLKVRPIPRELEKRSQVWKPHRTVVSLFFWKIVDGNFEW